MKNSSLVSVLICAFLLTLSSMTYAVPPVPPDGTDNILQGSVQENHTDEITLQLKLTGTNQIVDLQIGGVTLGQVLAIRKVLQPGNLVQVWGGFDGYSSAGRNIFSVYEVEAEQNCHLEADPNTSYPCGQHYGVCLIKVCN